ncbi:MAG: PAS domain S-box protein [Rhodoferax sp.]|nr:PAS domain S-box protein [Rhodoferax sp.]MCF8207916.1 PAS domain S-box protein [Rhodoferax sp.]
MSHVFSAMAYWRRSLKVRVTLLTLAIFIGSIWTLAVYSSNALREDMQHQLGEQQFATVSAAAAEINDDLSKRLRVLSAVAARITPTTLGDRLALQAYLQDRLILQEEFNAGAFAVRSDGAVLADSLGSGTRLMPNIAQLAHVAAALREGRPSIGLPHFAQALSRTEFEMAVPIRGLQGQVIGALVGVTDLSRPNLLDPIANRRYGDTGGYLLNAPQARLIISASDSRRVMQPFPAPGVNQMLDRFVQGFEGYGVTTNARGVEELTAAKGIPVAGWFLGIVIPTAEAFAPVQALRERVLQSAVGLTLLAGMLVWWMLRRQLAPLQTSTRALAKQLEAGQLAQALPVARADEIGALLTGFNQLLQTLVQREATLRQSEGRFRHFFEKNCSVLLLIDPEAGAIINANLAAVTFYGFPQDQLIGMPIKQINTLDPEQIALEMQHALQEQRNYFNFCHRLANGLVRDVEVYSTPVEMDNRVLLFSIVHDISERKGLQETLKESELRYRTVADFTVDWEYWILPNGTLRYISPSCEQISGYSAEQFYAHPELLTDIIHPDDMPLFEGHNHRLSTLGVPLPVDFRIVTKGGETRWISHVCRPVFDESGQALGLRASNRDISERKNVETALARSNADLQRFSEVTAHHLQEPARRMSIYAERLTRQLAGRIDNPEAQLSLTFIGQQARRQQNLLRDVERYLAADQPRGVVQMSDAQHAVHSLLARWKTRVDQTGADIIVGNLPPAWIDQPRLNDLFEVALDNALCHGRSARPLQIVIAGQREGRTSCFSVSDNGAGVEPQYRERVFRVFERLAAGDEGASAGTGIGLAILRRITESCGGAARFEESATGGARLVFVLAMEKLT